MFQCNYCNPEFRTHLQFMFLFHSQIEYLMAWRSLKCHNISVWIEHVAVQQIKDTGLKNWCKKVGEQSRIKQQHQHHQSTSQSSHCRSLIGVLVNKCCRHVKWTLEDQQLASRNDSCSKLFESEAILQILQYDAIGTLLMRCSPSKKYSTI